MFTIYHLFGVFARRFGIIIKICSQFSIFAAAVYALGCFITLLIELPLALGLVTLAAVTGQK